MHDWLVAGFVEDGHEVDPPPLLVHASPQALQELIRVPAQHVLLIDLHTSSGSCLYSFTPAVVQACIGVNVRDSSSSSTRASPVQALISYCKLLDSSAHSDNRAPTQYGIAPELAIGPKAIGR